MPLPTTAMTANRAPADTSAVHAGDGEGSRDMKTRHEADIGQGRVGQHAVSSEAQSDSAAYEFQPQACTCGRSSAFCRGPELDEVVTENGLTLSAEVDIPCSAMTCTVPVPWQEEQLLELVMNGMRVAGLALALEAISSFVLGALATAAMPRQADITPRRERHRVQIQRLAGDVVQEPPPAGNMHRIYSATCIWGIMTSAHWC